MVPVDVVALECQEQKPPSGKPSGCVPWGDAITYWTSSFEVWVVLPKWLAAAAASLAGPAGETPSRVHP